ncbi:hybrid sensor histidine kinase/response regulator [Candidatus Phycosocius spiralis]|uniref:histidine kinase n=1 Tax=Candidatus Phycosocius spiralis TaxID=2815099 RepID=A0ABQ4PVQ6_9PROT|nr:hybrid sensor histidine kinase/response regulator [Candidatus Phycosocius spiralis]
MSFTIEDLPDCAIVAGANGRVLVANQNALHRFGSMALKGEIAPWFDLRSGWHVEKRADGIQLGIFRPDDDETARGRTMLFATLSHEIRTPLNGILGMAGLLSMSELTSAQRSWLNAVTDSGQHLLGLLNDILDYAKLESGKIELESLIFNPANMLQSVAELCSPRAHEKKLEIATFVAADVPLEVMGDDGRLRQIMLNLTSNAVKFTHSGGIVLRLECAGKNRLRFSVEDSGIGIPTDKLDHVFEEFQQADSSHTRRFGGTGLGLAIVKKLTIALGGSVHVRNRDCGGCVFWIDMPLDTITPAPARSYKLRGKTIAIQSTSHLMVDVIRLALQNEGAEVKLVTRPSQAKRACVILLDHHDNQLEITDWLKQPSPVIALIPQERRDLIDDYRAKGAIGYLIKPLRAASLIERVALAAGEGIDTRPVLANDERADTTPLAIGVRVLLADDNPINALLAKSLLMRNGCHVMAVGDGAEAVAALQDAPYDLVLMDVHMPVMDGLEATKALRALGGRFAQTPIIALTAAAMEEDRRACKQAGMDDFISKPLDPAMLSSVLERWTNSPRQATFAA